MTDSQIRYVNTEDLKSWFKLDKHLAVDEFYRKVSNRQGLVMTADNKVIGILRFNLFWDNTPFCNLLYIDEEYQQKSYGTKLMRFWENEMKKAGYGILLTSSRSDENAQHFYRKIGYCDCGNLNFPDQPTELFFIKKI